MLKVLSFLSITNIKLSFLDQVLISLSNFIFFFFVAKYTNITVFTEISVIWIFILFFLVFEQSFITFPLKTAQNNFNNNYMEGLILFQIIILIVSFIISYLLIGFIFYYFLKIDFYQYNLLVSICVINQQIRLFVRRFLFKINKGSLQILFLIIEIFFIYSFLILALKQNILNLENILLILTLCSGIYFLYFITLVFKYNFSKNNFKNYLSNNNYFYKWHLPANILLYFSEYLIVLMSGYYISKELIGNIRFFWIFIGPITVFFQSFENFFPNYFSKSFIKNENFNLRLFNFIIISLILISLCTLFIYSIHEYIIVNYFDIDYLNNIIILKYLLFFCFIHFFKYILILIFRIFNLIKYLLYLEILKFLFIIIFSKWFFLNYEEMGYIYLIYICEFISVLFLALLLFYYKKQKLKNV